MKKDLVRRAVSAALLFGLSSLPCRAVDVSLSLLPSIPLGNTVLLNDGAEVDSFAAGLGGSMTVGFETLGFLAPYAEFSFAYNRQNRDDGADASLSLFGGSAGLSLFYYPVPRILGRIGVSGGMGLFSIPAVDEDPEMSGPSFLWKAKADAGYRFSPALSLLASVGYSQYLGTDGVAFFKGLSAGLTVNLNLDALTNRGAGIVTETEQASPAFPVTYLSYAAQPVGTARVTNREQAEIREVELYFQAGSYTSGETLCARFPVVARGATVEVPILAAFNDRVLAFTESAKLPGELRVAYRLLDAKIEATRAVTVAFEHRNAMTWGDERLAASFVSPNDPVILDLSKFVAGLVRERVRPEIDKNLQYAMGLFEALRLGGLVWSQDPSTPYKTYHADPALLDYLQYPYQTLAYKGGDSDDIAVLYAEFLESVGVASALVPLDDEMLVAVQLSTGEAEARANISSIDEVLFVDGKAWAPIAVSLAREGFLLAWQGGAARWRDAAAAGSRPGLVVVSEAWKSFPPIGLPDVDYRPPKPSEEQINLAFDNVLGRFIAKEVTPKAKKMLSDMGSGGGTGKQRNALGVLYARYGLLVEAKAEFQLAFEKGFVSALVNMGNVAYLQKDFESAASIFERALTFLPENKAALIGLARARYELDAYAEADELFGRVRSIDPALAERYAYLSSKVDASTTRASSAAADRGGAMSWSEGD